MLHRIAILNLLFILFLVACSSTTPAAPTDIPATVPTTIPPTNTPAPTPEPTRTATPVSQFKSFPGNPCCNGRPVDAGEYELPSWSGIPLTMVVKGEGWRQINDEEALLFMLGKGRNSFGDPTQALVFIAVPDGKLETVLGPIRAEKGLTAQGEISETQIAGFPGLQVDLTAKPNPGYEGSKEDEILPGAQFLPNVNRYFTPGFIWTTWTAESRLRFIALTIDEQFLLIEIESPPAEFEAFMSEADRVLQTLKLRR